MIALIICWPLEKKQNLKLSVSLMPRVFKSLKMETCTEKVIFFFNIYFVILLLLTRTIMKNGMHPLVSKLIPESLGSIDSSFSPSRSRFTFEIFDVCLFI